MTDTIALTRGQSYLLHVSRHRSSYTQTYGQCRYLGPDPERDGFECFWWAEQSALLRVEKCQLESARVMEGEGEQDG